MAAAEQQPPPILGVLPAGQPLITVPTSQPTPTSFLYAVPQRNNNNNNPSSDPNSSSSGGGGHFSHLAVFLLPGITLPPNTAAAIYLALNPVALANGTEPPNFRFLGGVGPGKESAVFKLNADTVPCAPAPVPDVGGGGQQQQQQNVVVIGINIEDAGSVAERIQQQKVSSSSSFSGGGGGGELGGSSSSAHGHGQQPSTQVLAQRIIQNAYNFLSSFSGQAGEVEVVPLKAFQEWWKKFEGRVRSDPTFLERPQD